MTNTDRKEYLYVFDYSDCTINEIIVSEEDFDTDTDELLRKYHLNPDECVIMWGGKQITEIINLNNTIHG